jgi:hypothetical protein
MLNIGRCVSPLATVLLFAAVPSISPAGAARMEREKAEARENVLKMQERA